jgi:hypothetical protein
VICCTGVIKNIMNDNIVICFIDETDQCYSNYAREIVKNISDQTYATLSGKYPIYFNEIPKTDKQVVLVHTGIDIMYVGAFYYVTCNDPVVELRNHLAKGASYLDARTEESFHQGMGWQHHKFMSGAAVLFYAFNNEPMCEVPLNIIHQLVTPAAGLNWVEYLLKYGYDNTTKVRFTDCNYFALNCMKEIKNWDGKDYPSFIRQLGADSFNFLGMDWDIGIKNIHNLDTDWQAFLERNPNWETQWSDIKSKVSFEFKYINFYDITNNVVDWVDDQPNTFVNLSNIFSYFASTPFYSVKTKLAAETHIIKQLQKDRPNVFVNFQSRADGNFGGKGIAFGLAKDLNIVLPDDLTKLPWHRD